MFYQYIISLFWFLFHHTKYMVYFILEIKMADSGSNKEWREHLEKGRARTLIEAMEAVEIRGGIQQ